MERDLARPGFVDVALVRRPAPRRGLLDRLRPREVQQAVVLFHRTFNPMLDLAALEAYASQLELVARHANDGTFGCFVQSGSEAGRVQVTLYERWFDGAKLRCDELARREFDPDDESSLVASAEFLAELQDWAQRRNDEREASYRDAGISEAAATQQSLHRQAAADELASILASERRDA